MLVSAVLEPSAFDANYFTTLYTIQAVDFLKGIARNGVLILDSENRLRDAIVKQIELLPIKPRQRLQILIEELLLKRRSKRVIACSFDDIPSNDLSDLAYCLWELTKADALIVGNESLQRLKSAGSHNRNIVPCSEYRESVFEHERQQFDNQIGPIDSLSESEVENLIIRSIRFAKWLRFYDPYIGRGNTEGFREGIAYVLSLWEEHGFFASQQGIGHVEIFTCKTPDFQKGPDIEQQNQNIKDLITPLESQFPWSIKVMIKVDRRGDDRIFHARYLEAQHVIIRIDKGFDLFKRDGSFKRNLFSLNLAESPHLKQCRELPDADIA